MTKYKLLYIITPKGVVVLAKKMRQNITLDPDVYEEFCKYAGKKGIKVSTWVNIKMQDFKPNMPKQMACLLHYRR